MQLSCQVQDMLGAGKSSGIKHSEISIIGGGVGTDEDTGMLGDCPIESSKRPRC